MYRVSEFVISCRQVKVWQEKCTALYWHVAIEMSIAYMARWSTSNIYFNHMSKAWCGVILLYIVNVLVKSSCHDTTIRTETHQHILCKVNWFFQHEHHRYYDYPVEVWSKHFYSFSSGSYMPVFRITSHCATVQVRFSVYTPTNLHEYAQTLPQSLF